MPNDVGDEDRSAIEADAGEQLVEELPGGTHEGLALEVLVVARRLAEKEDARLGAAVAGDRLSRAPVERARRAGADLVGNEPKIGRGVVQRADYAADEGFRGAFLAR